MQNTVNSSALGDCMMPRRSECRGWISQCDAPGAPFLPRSCCAFPATPPSRHASLEGECWARKWLCKSLADFRAQAKKCLRCAARWKSQCDAPPPLEAAKSLLLPPDLAASIQLFLLSSSQASIFAKKNGKGEEARQKKSRFAFLPFPKQTALSAASPLPLRGLEMLVANPSWIPKAATANARRRL